MANLDWLKRIFRFNWGTTIHVLLGLLAAVVASRLLDFSSVKMRIEEVRQTRLWGLYVTIAIVVFTAIMMGFRYLNQKRSSGKTLTPGWVWFWGSVYAYGLAANCIPIGKGVLGSVFFVAAAVFLPELFMEWSERNEE